MNDRIIGILEDSFTQLIIPGITATILLTLISFAFGLAIALFLAIVRTKDVPVLATFARLYVWIFRGTPLLVQLFVIFYGLPSIGITLEAFPSAIIAFSLNVGAYASEAIRGAIAAVPKGQFDAGASMGMNYLQIMRFIILPQAIRIAYPPLFNEFISLVKSTSLASSITVFEMFMSAQRNAPSGDRRKAPQQVRLLISAEAFPLPQQGLSAPSFSTNAACSAILRRVQ